MTPDVGTEAVPRRKIPQKMWDVIADADRRAKFTDKILREELIDVGAQFGFSERDLVKRGIIPPRENPNPEPVGSTSTGEIRCSGPTHK